MKIEQLREKLRLNNKVYPTKKFADIYSSKTVSDIQKLKKHTTNLFRSSLKKIGTEKVSTDNNMKIIGITGSHGKSSVAFMIHEYLKEIGYKTVLYSSISVDSPASYKKVNEAVENPLRDQQMLLNAIEEAYAYNADFLILEVNERAIKKGLSKDIPFDMRIITNINPTHNTFFYPDYVEIKKQFFKEVNQEDDVVCLFNSNDKDIFNSLYESNRKSKVTYMSKYVANKRGINPNKVNYIMTANDVMDTIEGLQFIVKGTKDDYNIKTNMLFPHNALNITCVVASLETLGLYHDQMFNNFIKNLVVPGVDEVFEYKGRKIIVTRGISPHLEVLDNYKKRGDFSKLHLVAGTTGLGYKSWVKEFPDESYISEKEYSVSFAYKYAEKYVDKIYITTNDSAATNKQELMNYQSSFISNQIEKEMIQDRYEALSKAIQNSNSGDVILVSGRGNRRVMCNSENIRKLHLDSEAIFKLINSKELN